MRICREWRGRGRSVTGESRMKRRWGMIRRLIRVGIVTKSSSSRVVIVV